MQWKWQCQNNIFAIVCHTITNVLTTEKNVNITHRGVHNTKIPVGSMGPMGIPWEWEAWKHTLNSWE